MEQMNAAYDNAYLEQVAESARRLALNHLLPINVNTYPHDAFERLWDNISRADYAFEEGTQTKQWLAASMLEPNTFNFELPGKAFAQLNRAGPGSNAHVHFITFGNQPVGPLLDAARELFTFAFETVGVHRLNAWVPTFNYKAVRMAGLLAMKFEGQMRRAFHYHAQWWDIAMYALVEDEWRRHNGRG